MVKVFPVVCFDQLIHNLFQPSKGLAKIRLCSLGRLTSSRKQHQAQQSRDSDFRPWKVEPRGGCRGEGEAFEMLCAQRQQLQDSCGSKREQCTDGCSTQLKMLLFLKTTLFDRMIQVLVGTSCTIHSWRKRNSNSRGYNNHKHK